MNAIMMSAFLGLVGLMGTKAMDECCAKKSADCCTTKADNCCEKKMDGCCEKMKDECCTWTSVYDGKRISIKRHCVSKDSKAGECPSCVK